MLHKLLWQQFTHHLHNPMKSAEYKVISEYLKECVRCSSWNSSC